MISLRSPAQQRIEIARFRPTREDVGRLQQDVALALGPEGLDELLVLDLATAASSSSVSTRSPSTNYSRNRSTVG
ncbi:MAG: hypothetical protein U5K37_07695 [Natrialbaceae archaeon]|nr:hypothetical protein [Natrialbaceae archaeon]